MAEAMSVEELWRRLKAGEALTVIDVRLVAADAIAGAVHVPVTDLEDREWPFPRGQELVVYCQHGRGASDYAAEVLEEQGFSRVRTLSGGLDAWKAWVAQHPGV
jgi:rhodanese-related sulfurtransferase